jgi:3-oxoacyl-(acyl-carrier-protein) synthase
MKTRVVITGLGIMAPNGHGLTEYEMALRAGRSGIRFVPAQNWGLPAQVAGSPRATSCAADTLTPRIFSR